MNFADVFIKRSEEINSVLCVGLDPNLDFFPDYLTKELEEQDYSRIADAIFNFNKSVIDSVHDFVLAVKPQLAYYEPYGSQGIRALEQTIQYAKAKELIVINDAKRSDIGSTSLAYARAHLGQSPIAADMVTVNPFLGIDGYQPFIDVAQQYKKGLFFLLKTSNPSSSEFQDRILQNGNPVYREMCNHFLPLTEQTRGEQGYSFIGFVVGATYPDIAREIRALLPHSLFLVPGLGAQGGKAEDLKLYFDQQGRGAVISSSRGITYNYCKEREDWRNITEADLMSSIRNQALQDNKDLNAIRS